MKLNVEEHLAAVQRSVSFLQHEGKSASAVTLARGFQTSVEELWDVVTNGERIPRWFLPISGSLELGGRFQFEGNAGGLITACEAPSRLATTWEFAGDTSWVDVAFANDGAGGSRLSLTHTALLSPHWDQYGPGATGVGWEGGLLGLALHLANPEEPKPDVMEFVASPEGQAFYLGSSTAWGEAAIAAGTDPETAREAARQTTAFYTGQPAE